MKFAARTSIAALIASVVPAVPFLVISLLAKGQGFSLIVSLIAWAIGTAHIVLLGVPAFLFLLRKNLARSWPLAITGFVLGFAPAALYALPNSLRGGAANVLGPFVFGVIGAFSAWVFSLVWHRLGPNNSFKPNPLRSGNGVAG